MAIDSVIRDGGASEDLLHRRLAALHGKGRHGGPKVLAALEGADAQRGWHSWLERRFLQLLAEVGLPRPETQVHLSKTGDRLIRVDCRFPGTPLVVELLGYRWHRTEAQMASDTKRMNQLLLDGFQVVQFTYRDVTGDERNVIATTEQAPSLFSAARPRSLSRHSRTFSIVVTEKTEVDDR